MTQRDFLLWLLMVPGLSIKGRYRIWIYLRDNKLLKLPWQQILIISKMRQPKRDAATFWFKQTKWQVDWQRLRKQKFIAICDKEYPIYLYECIDAPICLFYKGDLSLLSQPLVAIVGSRQATKYGQGVLSSLIPDLAGAGLVTVSGLAAGIDELTHRETLKVKGKTVAVIGTGLDKIYPKRSDQLQDIIAMRDYYYRNIYLGKDQNDNIFQQEIVLSQDYLKFAWLLRLKKGLVHSLQRC